MENWTGNPLIYFKKKKCGNWQNRKCFDENKKQDFVLYLSN